MERTAKWCKTLTEKLECRRREGGTVIGRKEKEKKKDVELEEQGRKKDMR